MFVYVIAQPGTTIAKVGRARSVPQRLEMLRSSCPVPLELRAHWDACEDTEAFIFEQIEGRRVHHEWFEFGADDPVAVVTAILGRDPLPSFAEQSARKTRRLAQRQTRYYGSKPRKHPGHRPPREGWNVYYVDDGVAREYRKTHHAPGYTAEEYGDWLEPVEYVAQQGPDTVFRYFVPAGKYPNARPV